VIDRYQTLLVPQEVLLHSYTERIAGGDTNWWRAATRRTTRLLERGHSWIDTSRPLPRQTLLIDTTALLSYALARSSDKHPAAVTGSTLATWAYMRLHPLEQSVEHLHLTAASDHSALWPWHGSFGRLRSAVVQDVAYPLVAAGHVLPVPGDPARDEDPVVRVWTDLVERENPNRRYASIPGPALVQGLAEVVAYFGRPVLAA
jgi:hypothetical protein